MNVPEPTAFSVKNFPTNYLISYMGQIWGCFCYIKCSSFAVGCPCNALIYDFYCRLGRNFIYWYYSRISPFSMHVRYLYHTKDMYLHLFAKMLDREMRCEFVQLALSGGLYNYPHSFPHCSCKQMLHITGKYSILSTWLRAWLLSLLLYLYSYNI